MGHDIPIGVQVLASIIADTGIGAGGGKLSPRLF